MSEFVTIFYIILCRCLFLQLGHLNTPIHPWHLTNVPTDFKISLKRDDMTGSTCSGNKVSTQGHGRRSWTIILILLQ